MGQDKNYEPHNNSRVPLRRSVQEVDGGNVSSSVVLDLNGVNPGSTVWFNLMV